MGLTWLSQLLFQIHRPTLPNIGLQFCRCSWVSQHPATPMAPQQLAKLTTCPTCFWASCKFPIPVSSPWTTQTHFPQVELIVSDSVTFMGYVYCLWTYLLPNYWITVWKRLRTSLGTPLCILFCLFLTYFHFIMLLGVCVVHRTLLTEGSASTSTQDSCMVQETSMADGSTSKVLQTCVQYMEIPLVNGRHNIHSVLYIAMPHRSYLYLR